MIDAEKMGQYGQLARGLNNLFDQRIEEAESVEVLSDRGGKVVELWEEADGGRFVTRSFTREAVDRIEQGTRWGKGLKFHQAWDAMNDIFSDENMGVVPSVLRKTGDPSRPFVVVSEQIDDGISVAEAPTDFKVDLARSLGGLVTLDDHFPNLEMLQDDMFMVREEEGALKAVLIDVDPLIILKNSFMNTDINAAYLERISDLFWEKWCHPYEYEEVFAGLIAKVADPVTKSIEESDPTQRMLDVFSRLVLMKQGVDTRVAA